MRRTSYASRDPFNADVKSQLLKPTPEFWRSVEVILDARLAAVREYAFPELAAMPETTSQSDEIVDGTNVHFTVFAWRREPFSVVIVVQAAVKGTLASWRSFEKGFVATADGQIRAASSEEILSVL